ELTDTEITQRFEPEKIALIERFDPEKIISAVYLDNDRQQYNIKRFKIETTTLKSQFLFIKEGAANRLEAITTDREPILVVQTGRGQQVRKAKFKVAKMVEVMGWKAVGAKLTDYSKTIEMAWEQKPKEENTQPELFG
ncbi:MAG: DNA gyrase/topoisomerase IV subunit A, partial [Bacteroidota bacterium]